MVETGMLVSKPPYDRLYSCWATMRRRCSDPTSISWKNYGGRGIVVCSEWEQVQHFIEWALANGYRRGLQIDRIDVNGPYSPENCRWVTRKANLNNTRVNVRVTAFGETRTVAEWASDPRCLVEYDTLYSRIQVLGWNPERALMTKRGTRKDGNVLVRAFGSTRTLKEWSRDPRCVVGYRTLWFRIQSRHWDPELAITLPASYQHLNRRHDYGTARQVE